VQTKNPNRFFGSNPVSMPSAGKKEDGFPTELPRTWRSALGLEDSAGGPAGGAAAQSTQWEGEAQAG
jgi:hypothetical protein